MKFSKRVNYGLGFLLKLSLQWPQYCTVAEVAAAEGLPHKFLEAIAADLRKARIIEVKRGVGGGYRLSRSLKEVRLPEVLAVLEPEWQKSEIIIADIEPGKKAVQTFLNDVRNSVVTQLSEITLEQMVEHYRGDVAPLYFI
jgi:Rrf2 family protein